MIGRNNMKKIRTAIIGLGRIVHGYEDISSVAGRIRYPTHSSVLKKDKRFTLVAAADIDAKQRRLFQRKTSPDVAMYADYRAMLKNEAIDLLVVAVPTGAHYVVCSRAIESGIKNILCEKPITRTIAEVEKLTALAKRHQAKIMVNYHRSHNKSYAQLARSIRKKKWGRAVSVSVQYNNGIFNTATHLIHLLEKMFGTMERVQSVKKSVRNNKDPNISFTAYVNGLTIFFEGVDNAKYRLLEVDMKFETGRLVLSNDSLSEFKPEAGQGLAFLKISAPSTILDIGRSMLDVYENIFQVMKHKKAAASDLAAAARALRVAAKAIESAAGGKLLNI